MQAIKGGLSRRKKHRHAVRWALAIVVLALVLPATAMGAQGQMRTALTTTRATAGATGADGASIPRARLGHNLLALGGGYGIRDGSPLVRDLQRRLALADYPAGRVDGLFGPQTWRALVAFQASHGLKADGIVGPQTWAALSAPALILGPGARDQPGGFSAVRSLQRLLASAGYTPGPIDGRYGALTEQAVRRFQSARRLPATGMSGARTLALLGVSLSHKLVPPFSHKLVAPHEPTLGFEPQGSNPGPPAAGANVAPAPAQRQATATPTAVPQGSSRRSGSRALPIVTIAGGLALLLALMLGAPLMAGAVRHSRRRRDDETDVASSEKLPVNRVFPGETQVATAPDEGRVTPRQSVRPVSANGHHVQVAETAADAACAFDVGVWLEAQGSMAEAEAAYGRADERGHGAAASNLGRLLEEQGALAAAEAAYRRADQRGDGVGAFNLGVLLEDRGEVDEAEAAYRRAADRGHDAAATNLGVLLEEHGALDEAEVAYRRAVEGGAAAASFNLGVLLEERGDLPAAEEAYRRAEERGDKDVANMARAALVDLHEPAERVGAGRVRGTDYA
jgi:peptidoglycan hydrolase-like protein with peptidoglycan-binding domain/TPR repeat protein